ncbi:FliO/MopB family protein [Paeniglutamicibacter cryotolerans]|uniref:Flagellar protein FliO/FliZ n=1 Tax=Paeniglutamicibacter cryotolerans TaxID=670079 RepID=A0A839QE63_9MICC|nr:flagellar biosynthetic protein FliO [Paeniglutamicibacter cryotolerans]MBB2993883.1 flagellar protein FliO/FliZ [Paeniglutamicibacter cryotolerans]
MDTFFLLLRVLVSLAAVLGLLFYLRKRLLPRFASAATGEVRIIERHGVGPKSSVVLLESGSKRYLLGVGEASVNVLDSYDAPEVQEPELPVSTGTGPRFALSLLKASGPAAPEPKHARAGFDQDAEPGLAAFDELLDPSRRSRRTVPGPLRPQATGVLAGSILSPATWKQAAEALKRSISA